MMKYLVIALLALVMTGCASVEKYNGTTQKILVQGVNNHSAIKATKQLIGEDEVARRLIDQDLVSGAFERDWTATYSAGAFAPKSLHIAEGDIVEIEIHIFPEINKFNRLLSRKGDGKCEWVGSKILTDGGTQCK